MSGAKGEVSATDKARKGVVRAHREPPTCKETGAEMLARQQQEVKQQQNKEVVLKKAAAKGSKTERKAKKKQAEEEIARLDVKLRTRHAKELASLGYKIEDDRVSNGLDGSVRAVSGISVTESQSGKVCRSQKWREKRAQKEADREQRIQEEQSSIISDRVLENQNLEHKLQPLGFSLHEIKPDGHCLYRAVENQLSLYPGIAPQYSYQQLREIAAAYMRSHAEDFLPFFLDGSDNEIESEETRQKSFEKYCREIESTASWGGQLELGALAHTLRKHIVIYFGNFPDVEMGKEYEFESLDGLSLNPSIRISYHQHAFGLGEHYNSVIPAQARKSFEFCT